MVRRRRRVRGPAPAGGTTESGLRCGLRAGAGSGAAVLSLAGARCPGMCQIRGGAGGSWGLMCAHGQEHARTHARSLALARTHEGPHALCSGCTGGAGDKRASVSGPSSKEQVMDSKSEQVTDSKKLCKRSQVWLIIFHSLAGGKRVREGRQPCTQPAQPGPVTGRAVGRARARARDAHARTLILARTHAPTCVYVCASKRTHARLCAHAQTHARLRARADTHKYTHTRASMEKDGTFSR